MNKHYFLAVSVVGFFWTIIGNITYRTQINEDVGRCALNEFLLKIDAQKFQYARPCSNLSGTH